ncbi:helix-turn-helix transcriptional regulator [Pelagovum pacificum]|uniref:LuxR family transcriptional regulator n=1 Tax=Pelagovum pacificum TaxID=2588711 RepID=A0A5C5GBE7_9RHOB|nr:LuxR family transcriptional regulator [Pelagovum pacificum]QQA44770.1 LuxR family transcriptional regulator [Pelagovum pacificum]TNY32122.1 LuxR family transcriptional regulator [Pelagovum pacificum]
MSKLIEYLEALTNATTVQDAWELHVEKMASYGFDRLLYGFTRYRSRGSLGDPQDWIVLTNHSAEYMDVFIDEGLYFHAPMVRWALENNGACSWRWIAEPGNLTAAEERVVEFNRSMGVTCGYTISFRSVSERTKGAIALTGTRDMSQQQVEEIWAEHGSDLVVMNNVAHLKLLSLPYAGSRTLTRRQKEVLQWVGDGKTTQDIALLLGLTPATVEKHLRLAREALDVETTAQAVLKASFYNQMFVLEGA